MNCTVWTAGYLIRVKCIFKGNISAIPDKSIGIVVREGFCVEEIDYMYYNLVRDELEIHLKTDDYNNEYGKSLIV